MILPCAGKRLNSRPAYMKTMPIAVSAPANPRLNANTKIKPKPILFKAIAPSMTTSAEGQGIKPPEMPSANKLRQVIGDPSAPGGRWE